MKKKFKKGVVCLLVMMLVVTYKNYATYQGVSANATNESLGAAANVIDENGDVYVNGNYQGNYLLIESIDIGDGRIEIDAEDETNDDILLEIDNNNRDAAEAGKLDTQMGASTTATYYARTMNVTGLNKTGYTVTYLVRAYVKDAEGNVTYSDVMSYSINDIAAQLYDNDLMSTYNGHNALYDNILTKVDEKYKAVDYDFQNTMADKK